MSVQNYAALLELETHEDYLNSHISAAGLYYLEDEELARQLVELGYRGNGEVNFQALAETEAGLMFKNKRDRKVIDLDVRRPTGDHSTRTEIPTDEDDVVMRKSL
eukprot:Clim_evm11s231 gene=Clim_evmTU11s231